MAVLERVLSDQWTEAMATAWGGLWQVQLRGRRIGRCRESRSRCAIGYGASVPNSDHLLYAEKHLIHSTFMES